MNYKFIKFPDPNMLPPNLSFCVGGKLDTNHLISAYKQGYFPWFLENEQIQWHSPNLRSIIIPKFIKSHKSLKPFFKKYEVKFDEDVKNFINLCYKTRKQKGITWLSSDIVQAYSNLADLNIAHSVEVYENNELIGGLYGLIFGRVFCGESMLSLKPNASKVALVILCKALEKYNFLIDSQAPNNHLNFMGAINIKKEQFLKIYLKLIDEDVNLDFKNLKPNL
ncbi:leucyl/phenylalanyl-tRNA--protein transferase [Campylobacter sp. FMV-PI01]|uniref:Leucyl/phenylalanyl-tRNA--protein transferase n=1 Tax=Campylobacter portucalensis TaxID=2608384 RepID=A0A6L5WIB6_9BACT|nr:leucyl/phenylalanyl-tRNA--protein transferase [Campylobacter portucalensis]MSN96666.1 leucyl/phenylalanyl-tRNA--protein transferase [Campylobacter portucalensis]